MEFMLYRLLAGRFRAMDKYNIPIHVHGLGHIEAYQVREDELKSIEREGNDLGVDFQVAQFSITLGLSFLANILLTPVPPGKIYDTFVIIIVVGILFGITHLIKWHKHRGRFSATIADIRQRRFGPGGQEGMEMNPSDLANLQPTEPVKPPKEEEVKKPHE
jgi:hypothetical protein